MNLNKIIRVTHEGHLVSSEQKDCVEFMSEMAVQLRDLIEREDSQKIGVDPIAVRDAINKYLKSKGIDSFWCREVVKGDVDRHQTASDGMIAIGSDGQILKGEDVPLGAEHEYEMIWDSKNKIPSSFLPKTQALMKEAFSCMIDELKKSVEDPGEQEFFHQATEEAISHAVHFLANTLTLGASQIKDRQKRYDFIDHHLAFVYVELPAMARQVSDRVCGMFESLHMAEKKSADEGTFH